MKSIVSKKMVEVDHTTFVADDGVEFDDYNQCYEYEKETRLEKLENSFATIAKRIDIPSDDEDIYWLVKLKSNQDWRILKDYATDYCNSSFELSCPKVFPQEYICLENYDYNWFGIYEQGSPKGTASKLIDVLLNAARQLGWNGATK